MENTKKKKKKSIFKRSGFYIFLTVLIVAVLGAISVFFMPRSQPPTLDTEVVEEVRSVSVENGRLSKTFQAAGTLSESSPKEFSLEGELEIEKYLVEEGDYVEAGQDIARLDEASVVNAIYELNALLEELDADIAASVSDTVPSLIKAPSSGRIKAVYVKQGDSVQDVMYEHSALMRLSLGGLMAVDIEGRMVTDTPLMIRLSDGTELKAAVSKSADGIISVTCSDEKAPYGDSVEVYTPEGERLGGGELYIWQEVKICGFAGTVSSVYADVGALVTAEYPLIAIKENSYSGERNELLKRRRELEDGMALLFDILESGTVTAPSDGRVSQLNGEALAEPLAAWSGKEDHELVSILADTAPRITLLSAPAEPPQAQSETFMGEIKEIDKTTQELVITVYNAKYNSEERVFLAAPANVNIKVGDWVWLKYTDGQLSDMGTLKLSAGGSGGGGMGGGMSGGGGGGSGGSTGSQSSAAAQQEQTQAEEEQYSIGETSVCLITPYDNAEISFTVDERDVVSLNVGMKAEVRFDALPAQSFEAEIRSIDPKGTNDGGSSKYSLTAKIERSAMMLSGMNCSLYFVLGDQPGLILPVSALEERQDGTFVYTGYDSENDALTGAVKVVTGYSDGESVIIEEGLSAGDTVFYRYAEKIQYNFTR